MSDLNTRVEERLGIAATTIASLTAQTDPTRGVLVIITSTDRGEPHIRRWDVHRCTMSKAEWHYLNSGNDRPSAVEASHVYTDTLTAPR